MLAEKFFLFLETIISHLTDTARYPDGAPKVVSRARTFRSKPPSPVMGKAKHGGDACPRNDPDQWQQKLDRMRWAPIGPSFSRYALARPARCPVQHNAGGAAYGPDADSCRRAFDQFRECVRRGGKTNCANRAFVRMEVRAMMLALRCYRGCFRNSFWPSCHAANCALICSSATASVL